MQTRDKVEKIGLASLVVSGMKISFKNPDGQAVVIIDGLSFEAHPGTLVCLSGRSGSGKSSIIRQLVGIIQAAPGVVMWNDEDISRRTIDEIAVLRRTMFSYVDQTSGLIDHLTALENVLLPFIPEGKTSAKKALPLAEEALSSLGMWPRAHWKSSQLSGGEKQRVAVARALCADTPALVIDEPTASLDRVAADRVIEELKNLSSRGKTVIVASHDPHFLSAADQIVELENGRHVQ